MTDEPQSTNRSQNHSSVDIGDVDSGIHNSTIAGRDVHIHGDQIWGDYAGGDYIRVKIGDNAQNVIVGKDNQIIINSAGTSPLYVNVPAMPNYFLGREELIDLLTQQLVSQHHLAFSMEGLPGVGKTTLAVAVAHRVEVVQYFNDGVLWAGLGQQADIMGILASWAEALRLDISNQNTIGERSQAIKTAIGQRKFLIVIDDVWGIDDARYLRSGGPNCCHILTTRNQDIAQDFAGDEQVISVPVLDDDTSYQLLQKLAPKAYAANPETAQKLARAVGGLLLTLELLGGYLAPSQHSRYAELGTVALSQVLNPQERLQLAAQRLGSMDSPKVSLQATIMLSLEDESLPKEAVSTFYALGAFASKPAHFDRSAAEVVAKTNLATLAILASRNLLDDSQGLEQLALHQELANAARTQTPPEAIQRHRTYYLDLVNEDPENWRRIESVYGQIKWAWVAAPDEVHQQIEFLEALGNYQFIRGVHGDRINWLERLLQLVKTQGEVEEESRVLRRLGGIYPLQGRWEEAIQMCQDSLAICYELGDTQGESRSLRVLGDAYSSKGDFEKSIQMYKNCLAICRQLGDTRYEVGILNNMGVLYRDQRRWKEAIQSFNKTLNIFRQLDDTAWEGLTLNNLGMVYEGQARWKKAIQMYEDSLTISRQEGHTYVEAYSLNNLGRVYFMQKKWEEAIQMYEASLALYQQSGHIEAEGRILNDLAQIYESQEKWDDAIQAYRHSLSIIGQLGKAHDEGQTLYNLGNVYSSQGEKPKAMDAYQKALIKLHPNSPEYKELSELLQHYDD